MGLQTRNKSSEKVTSAIPIPDQNLSTVHRPDLTRIHTNSTPSSNTQAGFRRESDQLIYSGSTISAKSTQSSKPPSTPIAQKERTASFSIPGSVPTRAMSHFALLPPTEEDDLHAKRLLNIEEKPFKRIQKRLLAPTNPFQEYLRRVPTDAPSSTSNAGNGEILSDEESSHNEAKTQEELDTYLKQIETFSHQTIHDFSALATSLARLQFLLSSNEKERTRYANQVSSITEQHGTIRSNTVDLRTRLSEAREQLAKRKGYDTLAEKVLWVDGKVGGERSKTREELGRESEKLRSEIEELEREGAELRGLWVERRDALGNVVSEAGRLRRIVRGEGEQEHVEGGEEEEKEDDARSEGEGEGEGEDEQQRREDENEDEGMLGAGDRDGESHVGTPRVDDDGASTPLPRESGGLTPLPTTQESGGQTPRSVAGDVDAGGFTPRPATAEGGSGLKNEMQAGDDDVDMVNITEQQSADVPEVKVDDAEKAEVDEMET